MRNTIPTTHAANTASPISIRRSIIIESTRMRIKRKNYLSVVLCSLLRGLSLNKAAAAVSLAKNGLFDLTRGVTGNVCEDKLAGTLVSGKTHTELIYLILT
jgi:hypothetical protein